MTQTDRYYKADPALLGSLADLAPQAPLAERGQTVTCCYYIVSGRVLGYTGAANGNERSTLLFGPGMLLLADALMAGQPAPLYLKAATPLTVRRLTKCELTSALRRPEYTQVLTRCMADASLHIQRSYITRCEGDALIQVARELLDLRETYGADDDGWLTLPEPLPQEQLAYSVGLHRITVVRALRELGKRQLIVCGRGRYAVPDPAALRHFAEAGADTP